MTENILYAIICVDNFIVRALQNSGWPLLAKGVMLYEEVRKNFDMGNLVATYFPHKSALTARLAPSG
ncbi:MAG TPA: hypothetical protein H9835_01965 [Candidatus Agathobaculum merdigallinarum]|nr:hypothetical protein [Candidatus Agathobaculum merdigallinarum]